MDIIKKKPLIQTSTLPEIDREEFHPKARGLANPLTTADVSNPGGFKLSDQRFVLMHGTSDDFAEMRKRIELRRADQPKSLFFRCSKCGFRTKIPFRENMVGIRIPCLYCNRDRDKKGGYWKEMSKGEIVEWEKDKKAEFERTAQNRRSQREAVRLAGMVDWAKSNPR